MKHKGFTLVELLVGIVLISIVIAISMNMIVFSNKSHSIVVKEYEIQSAIRIAVEETNRIVRYSSALFAVPKDYFHVSNINKLDEGWHYFGVSEDKKRIIKYTYVNENGLESHKEETIVPANDNIEYELVFEKSSSSKDDNRIKMKVTAFVMNNGRRSNKKIEIDTEIEVLNALQVTDKGTMLSPAIALAYRGEERPIKKEVVAAISMVLDVSGSMNWKLDGSTTSNMQDRRITKVKNALVGYSLSGIQVEGMISEFAKEDNIEIAIVPFARTANYNNPASSIVLNGGKHPFYSVSKDASQKDTLINRVNALSPNGGTNTGDGMRQAYYRTINFKDENASSKGYSASAQIRKYMIILVDGETTMASVNGVNKYQTEDGPVTNTSWWSTNSTTFNYHGIIGNGSTRSQNTENYIKQIGAMIKASGIKVYLIAYAPGITDGIDLIAQETGAAKVYNYSEDMNLDEIFSEIKGNIMEDIWHISGPQIIK